MKQQPANLIIARYLEQYVPEVDPGAPRATKDQRSQIEQFLLWLATYPQPLDGQLLATYAAQLEQERQFKASSIRAYLASARAWLRHLLLDPSFRQGLIDFLRGRVSDGERVAQELVNRLWEAIDPKSVPTSARPVGAKAGFCPTVAQVQALLKHHFRLTTVHNLRDAAVLVCLAVPGLRQNEICALEVSHFKGAEGVLEVPDKPGCTARTLDLKDYPGVGELIQAWVDKVDLHEGPLFRGFYRNSMLRPQAMSLRSIELILDAHPLRNGHILKPLELRRFAARLLAQQALSLEQMCYRLGVAQSQTILNYLGNRLPDHQTGEAPVRLHIPLPKEDNALW